MLRFTALATMLLIGTGCSKVDSEHVSTSGMSAEIDVTGRSDGTTEVETRIKTGSGVPFQPDVELTGGDYLQVSAGGQTQRMTAITYVFSGVYYVADLDFNDTNTEFVVGLIRPSNTNAPNSRVTAPSRFVIEAPLTTDAFRRGENIALVWSPAEPLATMDLETALDCENAAGERETTRRFFTSIADSGRHVQAVNELLAQISRIAPTRCTATATLNRSREGTLDPAFGEGGRIRAHQEVEVTFAVIP